MPFLSSTFALYNPLQNEDVQHGNTEDMGNSRSFGQLAMQIAEPLMGGDTIAGFDSFVDHRDDEEKLLEVLADSDSDENSDGDTTSITDSKPSITRPVMTQSQDHPCHYLSLNLDAMQ